MNRVVTSVCCFVLAVFPVFAASSENRVSSSAAGGAGMGSQGATASVSPFSYLALGGGFSSTGINLQAATNVSRNFNVRAIGNVFKYTVNDLSSKGFNGTGKLNMATFGASLDYYPFPTHGFRLSPGLLFYNQNVLTGSGTVAANQTFTLNNETFYSSPTQPVQGTIDLRLNTRNPAFTMTMGWGNMISRTGGRWSFPIEVGAAFTGDPKLSVTLTGQGCTAQGDCANVATDPTIQSNLKAQVAKSQADLNGLRVYPIVSFGVAYSFRIR